MNKQEFVKAWAEANQMTVKEAEKLYGSFIDVVAVGLAKDKKVTLVGLGNFELKHKPAVFGKKNPLTGGTYDVAESNVPVFKANSKFKERFNQ